ncbi:hypothetical protein [Mycobacterium sp.]|uniref:hypothetical protein n=1 Tax=Mycobacterium sp. TaxID=1785 RepID=UPI002BFE9860|nr:hypothetical protein [Mycobacterium sp.]HTY35401.1 hypothetical protein [Mycobacterium sp.]
MTTARLDPQPCPRCRLHVTPVTHPTPRCDSPCCPWRRCGDHFISPFGRMIANPAARGGTR